MTCRRVLVVDDDPIITLETGDYLEAAGFEVVRADCAGRAMTAIEEQRPFSALVTDIELGDEASGFAVAQRLWAICPDTPVVFISGSEAARREAETMPSSAFIPKPFCPRDVARALERCAEGLAS